MTQLNKYPNQMYFYIHKSPRLPYVTLSVVNTTPTRLHIVHILQNKQLEIKWAFSRKQNTSIWVHDVDDDDDDDIKEWWWLLVYNIQQTLYIKKNTKRRRNICKRSNISKVNRYDLCTFDYVQHIQLQEKKTIEISYSISIYMLRSSFNNLHLHCVRIIYRNMKWNTKKSLAQFVGITQVLKTTKSLFIYTNSDCWAALLFNWEPKCEGMDFFLHIMRICLLNMNDRERCI